MTCLDDRAVHAWIGGELPETQRDLVRTHLDSCDSCRELVASSIEGQWIGKTAGRYRLIELIGAGAMGEVYRAEDPDLGRDIAIKILHAGGSQTRLLREAKVMAQLAHANVIRIYDVGTLDDRVFLAMELVKGSTLRAWFERKDAWLDVVATTRQAGNGLAAAHAAGLVHGDFKPDNVLVADDGRVLVTDFGLARLATDESAAAGEIEIDRVREIGKTQTRGLAGTPAYMAPEQLAGAPATAASDQFSFCVTLFEGIYGQRPFKGADVGALRAAQSTLLLPPRPAIPRRVAKVLRRGLSKDPAARYPAMTDLLAELERSPRKLLLAVVPLVATGAILTVFALRSSGGPACADGAEQLAGVWDVAARTKLEQAFEASKLPYAETSLATVTRQLDRYSEQWAAAYTETCEATHARRAIGDAPRSANALPAAAANRARHGRDHTRDRRQGRASRCGRRNRGLACDRRLCGRRVAAGAQGATCGSRAPRQGRGGVCRDRPLPGTRRRWSLQGGHAVRHCRGKDRRGAEA